MDRWSRRQFVRCVGVAGLGVLATCSRSPGPAPPRAPRSSSVPRVGFLSVGSPDDRRDLDALRQGLRDFGYEENQTVVIEPRYAMDDYSRLPALAHELVQLSVDVLVASGGTATQAAKQATGQVPIVMITGSDPVRAGFVASLSRPGGNVTGPASITQALIGKRLEYLKESFPDRPRVGALWNADSYVETDSVRELESAAAVLGLEVQAESVRQRDEIDGAFATLAQRGVQAFTTIPSGMLLNNRAYIAQLCLRYRLPSMFDDARFVAAGGLLAYGANQSAIVRRAAYYVDRILKGVRPADLPVEQPTVFDLVINLQTARALGLTIPQHVLLQATEIVQ
jgi:putative tryptophan/tyrosine transport system substrate-binding protein